MRADAPGGSWTDAPLLPRIPSATYRLQLNARCTFADAERLVPYLDALGVSDVYASSYLGARPGSMHGYDITNHNILNPEIGAWDAYDRYVTALRAAGMGHILDVVPNHMGIAAGCNAWWNDVLENGPSSPYADFFDVDWDPVKRQLANKVLLPILGDQYGRALENQELALDYADGAFGLRFHEARLPIAPQSTVQILTHRLEALASALGDESVHLQEYHSIVTALTNLPGPTERAPDRIRERLREKEVIRRRLLRLTQECEPIRASIEETIRVYNGKQGDPRSFDLLDRLLGDQTYRLAHWRVAAEEINYRRFFDVNDLAAIRMENPSVFRETHRLVLRLVAEGKVTGIRLDHPDGLFDPERYFLALQRERALQVTRTPDIREAEDAFARRCRSDPTQPGCRPLYLLAEKILAKGERLPAHWAVHGTTGYEFLNLVNGLFVDSRNERAMTAACAAFTGRRTSFADLAYESKRLIMGVSMSSELNVLGHALDRLSEQDRHSRDFTLNSLTEALREIIACFPVYRTYIDGRSPEVSLQDRACVEVAAAFAKRRNPATNVSVFDFVRDTLLLRYPENADGAYRKDQLRFVQKFQQVTAPVMAKGVEDTAFYRYPRLVSLNEVGGAPDRFGLSVEEFHQQCLSRVEKWPAGLSATSTHDTKRGEDVRARINALSEIPRAWRDAVARWHRWNRRHLTVVDGRPAPDRNDAYLLYQTLVGAWPLAFPGPDGGVAFTSRIQQYMLKAAKEAKLNTSWVNPNEAYDDALRSFVAGVLAPGAGNRFLTDFTAFHIPIARLGMVNSLAQTLLKITAPGVPDFYQGTEVWDFSLVDPDNRRPVDFSVRASALTGLRERMAAGDLASLARELVRHWEDGRIKLYVIHRALACRRQDGDVFQRGDYLPLRTVGAGADRLIAFARRGPRGAVVTLVPRLTAPVTEAGARAPLGSEAWADTRVLLPSVLHDAACVNLFTGAAVSAVRTDAGPSLAMEEVMRDFPVALLRWSALAERGV